MTEKPELCALTGGGELKAQSIISNNMDVGDMSFVVNGYGEVIKIKGNGDIFVKGNLTTNDIEVVEGFREFFGMSKAYNNAWYDTAAQMSRNSDYYRGLVIQIGKMLGDEAYISDDGSVQDDILCAKIPELVAARLRFEE